MARRVAQVTILLRNTPDREEKVVCFRSPILSKSFYLELDLEIGGISLTDSMHRKRIQLFLQKKLVFAGHM